MKAKKLLAILVSLCMLLVLVPAFTLMASADVTIPDPVDGYKNYAVLSTGTMHTNNSGVAPTVDTEAGTIALTGTTNGNGRIRFTLDGLETTDDYVIKWTVGGMVNWYNATWVPYIGLKWDASTSNAASTQKFVLSGKAAASTFTDDDGTSATVGTSTYSNSSMDYVIYADYSEETGKRTYHLFYNGGTYVYSSPEVEAGDPELIFGAPTGAAKNFTISNLEVYNPNGDPVAETYTITVTEPKNGTVTTEDALTDLAAGTKVTLTAAANAGYEFAGWKKNDDTTYVSTATTLEVEVAENATYTAVFTPVLPGQLDGSKNYMELIDLNGASDTASANCAVDNGDGTYTVSGTGKIIANMGGLLATEDYVMQAYVGPFANAGQGYNMKIYLAEDVYLYVTGTNKMYIKAGSAAGVLLNAVVGDKSYKTVAASAVYDEATGTRDYHVFVDGVYAGSAEDQPANDPYFMITGRSSQTTVLINVSNLLAYNPNGDNLTEVTVTLNQAEGGTAEMDATGTIYAGDVITLTATAAEGYTFVGWFKDDAKTFCSTLATFTIGADNATYTPKFIPDVTTYTIKVSWSDMAYSFTGVLENEGVVYAAGTTATFTTYEGATVKVTGYPNADLSKHAAIKDGDNGWKWLAAHNYTIESVSADTVSNFVIQSGTNPYLTIETEGEGTVDMQSGYLQAYSNHTITATPAEGWNFSHFVWADTNQYANPFGFNAGTASATLKAVFVDGYVVRVGAVDETVGTASASKSVADYGETVTFTATEAEGYTFRYWQIGNRTYTDKVLKWTVNGNVVAIPVFVETAPESVVYTVEFRSYDGRLIATNTYDPATGKWTGEEPTEWPVRYGYNATGWNYVREDGLSCDCVVTPNYTKDPSVQIEIGGTSYQFEDRVTVNASNPETFVAWVDENGAILSTDPNYTFLATGSITLTESTAAITVAGSVTAPTALCGAVDAGVYRLSLVANTFVAEGYTFVEAGVLYSTSDANVDPATARKKVSSTKEEGQFMYSLNGAPATSVIYAKAYVVVKDASGNVLDPIYSEVTTIPAQA